MLKLTAWLSGLLIRRVFSFPLHLKEDALVASMFKMGQGQQRTTAPTHHSGAISQKHSTWQFPLHLVALVETRQDVRVQCGHGQGPMR